MVSYLGRDNAARTLISTVTVNGLSFGAANVTPSSRIDSAVCATAVWTAATTINCWNTNSPSVVSTEVTVGGLVGTRYPAFTFDCAVCLVAKQFLFVFAASYHI